MKRIRAHAIRVGSAVVVAITVVVDISKVRRRNNITQPPVRTFNEYPTRKLTVTCFDYLCPCSASLVFLA